MLNNHRITMIVFYTTIGALLGILGVRYLFLKEYLFAVLTLFVLIVSLAFSWQSLMDLRNVKQTINQIRRSIEKLGIPVSKQGQHQNCSKALQSIYEDIEKALCIEQGPNKQQEEGDMQRTSENAFFDRIPVSKCVCYFQTSEQNDATLSGLVQLIGEYFPYADVDARRFGVYVTFSCFDSEQEVFGQVEEFQKLWNDHHERLSPLSVGISFSYKQDQRDLHEEARQAAFLGKGIRVLPQESINENPVHSETSSSKMAELLNSFDQLGRNLLKKLPFDCVGMISRDIETEEYKVLSEVRFSKPSILEHTRNSILPWNDIGSFLDSIQGRTLWGVSKRGYLSRNQAEIAEKWGADSVYFIPHQIGGSLEGLCYLLSEDPTILLPEHREVLRPFLSQFHLIIASQTALAQYRKRQAEHRMLLKQFGGVLYSVDPSCHSIRFLSLPDANPNEKKCHEFFFGSSEPCPSCPLLTRSPMVAASPVLGKGNQRFVLLQDGTSSTLLISPENIETEKQKDASFAEIFEKELIYGRSGSILFARLEDYVKEERDSVDRFVRGKMEGLGLAEDLYEYQPGVYAFVLRGVNQRQAAFFAAKIHEALRMPPGFSRFPIFSWSMGAFEYPYRVNSLYTLNVLYESTMEKAKTHGLNRFLSLPNTPSLSLMDRLYEATNYILHSDHIPLRFSVLYECKTRIPRYVVTRIDTSRFEFLSTDQDELYRQLMEGPYRMHISNLMLMQVEAFLWKNLKDLHRLSLKEFHIEIPSSYSLNEQWVRRLCSMVRITKCPKGFLKLRTLDGLTVSHNLSSALSRVGVEIVTCDFAEDKRFSFLDANAITAATTSLDALLRLQEDVNKSPSAWLVARLHNKKEKEYATALDIPYGTGPYYGGNCDEKTLLRQIRQCAS